jgi:hypothetical protein
MILSSVGYLFETIAFTCFLDPARDNDALSRATLWGSSTLLHQLFGLG